MYNNKQILKHKSKKSKNTVCVLKNTEKELYTSRNILSNVFFSLQKIGLIVVFYYILFNDREY
jgi:hypothetical protein